jgi:glutamate carboxypeptidase
VIPGDDAGGLPPDVFDASLALLEELTAISSASGDAAGLGRMAARLAAELAARGLEVEVRQGLDRLDLETPRSAARNGGPIGKGARRGASGAGDALGGTPATPALPVVVARGAEAAADRGHLLLIGHFDTVLPAAPPRRTAERLVATGAIDMKGGLAALAGALDLLARRGLAPPPDLLVVAVPDEETGGELARAAVERWGAAARALWVLEPGEPGSAAGAETLVGGRRGLFDWRLQARGKAAHSGLHLASGRSALLAAARWCLEAADCTSPTGAAHAFDAPTVNVGRLVAGDESFVTDLAEAHAWLGTDRQLNVVPDRAIAEGEARFATTAQGEAVARRLGGLAARVGAATGTALAWTRGAVIPPVDPRGPQRAWCERAVALAAARGWRLEIEERRGGISFPNFLPDPSRLPVLDGLGPVGGGMHTRDEYVDLVSLRRRIVLLADLLQDDAATRGRLPAD